MAICLPTPVLAQQRVEYTTSDQAFAAAKAARSRAERARKRATQLRERRWEQEDRATQIWHEIVDLNKEWEKTLEDLKKGRYCSRCERSATQIEKQERVAFERHLQIVKGTAIPAPKELVERKVKEYENLIQAKEAEFRRCQETVGKLWADNNQCLRDAAQADWEANVAELAGQNLKRQEAWKAVQDKLRQEWEAWQLHLEMVEMQRRIEAQRLQAEIQQKNEQELARLRELEKIAREFADNSFEDYWKSYKATGEAVRRPEDASDPWKEGSIFPQPQPTEPKTDEERWKDNRLNELRRVTQEAQGSFTPALLPPTSSATTPSSTGGTWGAAPFLQPPEEDPPPPDPSWSGQFKRAYQGAGDAVRDARNRVREESGRVADKVKQFILPTPPKPDLRDDEEIADDLDEALFSPPIPTTSKWVNTFKLWRYHHRVSGEFEALSNRVLQRFGIEPE